VFSPADLRAVRDAAVAHDCWVVADEVYERIVFDGEHRSVAALPGMAARTVTVGGFSKGHAMAGWRVGYLTGPPSLLDAVGKLQSHSVTSTAIFAQRRRGTALGEDGPAEPFERMVDAYETRRDALVDRLRDAGVDVHPPAGGLSAFVPVGGADDVALCERLLEDDHVALTPGTPFGREGYVRVCLTADRERIVAGLDALLDRLD
jgi:aspartate aminotransferase